MAACPIEHVWRSSYASNGRGAKVTFLILALCLPRAQILAVLEHVYTACLQNAAFALGTSAPTPVVSRPWPKAQPHPLLCSSFRNTEELTGLVSTEKSAARAGNRRYPLVCRFLARPCLSEQKEPAIHSVLCGVRSLPTAARQSQHAGRGLTVTVLCCVAGKRARPAAH